MLGSNTKKIDRSTNFSVGGRNYYKDSSGDICRQDARTGNYIDPKGNVIVPQSKQDSWLVRFFKQHANDAAARPQPQPKKYITDYFPRVR